jgi:hypothetical protein
LCSLMLSTHGAHMCRHQFARTWNYFGPEKEPPRGVQCPPCEPCLRPSFRVLLEDDITPGIAA